MTGMKNGFSKGSANVWLITTVVLSVTTIAAAGFLVWALVNYIDQKDNVDAKVATAVADAKKVQADELEAEFLEREKNPYDTFVGPDDYGRLMFEYPDTWSVYVERDTIEDDLFVAYLNPDVVPPVSDVRQFALRVTVETIAYEEALEVFQGLIEDGSLKSSSVDVNGQGGTRLEGAFSEDIRGTAVLFKIRDKTVTMRTDADTFREDFDKLISSVTFNK